MRRSEQHEKEEKEEEKVAMEVEEEEKEEEKEEEEEVVVDTLVRIARELYPSISTETNFQKISRDVLTGVWISRVRHECVGQRNKGRREANARQRRDD